MFIIGITGGSGSGKTTALCVLRELGALILDSDEIYHELLVSSAEMKSELAARYDGVVTAGRIDRKKLAEIVFNDPVALSDLNSITHKYVTSEVDRRISDWAEKGGAVAAVEAIALFESGGAVRCDTVIGITAPPEMRVSRIMQRDNLTQEQAKLRIDAQKPDTYYAEHCDHMLNAFYDDPDEFADVCEVFFKGLIENNI